MARKICSTENCKNPASKIAGENPDYCSSWPEPDPEYIAAVHESKPLTRKQCMEALKELGYVGPTSYLMPKVRAILAEVEAAAS